MGKITELQDVSDFAVYAEPVTSISKIKQLFGNVCIYYTCRVFSWPDALRKRNLHGIQISHSGILQKLSAAELIWNHHFINDLSSPGLVKSAWHSGKKSWKNHQQKRLISLGTCVRYAVLANAGLACASICQGRFLRRWFWKAWRLSLKCSKKPGVGLHRVDALHRVLQRSYGFQDGHQIATFQAWARSVSASHCYLATGWTGVGSFGC